MPKRLEADNDQPIREVNVMCENSVGEMVETLRAALLASPFNNFVKHDGPILPSSTTWEGAYQQDLKTVKVGGKHYAFLSGARALMQNVIGYAVFTNYPFEWVMHPKPVVVQENRPGVTVHLVTTATIIAMPDGSFRMYAHEYSTIAGVTADRGVYYYSGASEFPNTWHFGGIYLDVGESGTCDAVGIHNEITIPAWSSIDGQWHHLWGALDASNTWRSMHGTSADGLTVTRDDTPFLNVDALGKWDSGFKHVVGQPHRIGNVWFIPYQGFNGSCWQLSVCATIDFKTVVTHPSGPLVASGKSGEFDEGFVENPACVLRDDGGIDYIYTGSGLDGGVSGYRLGLARSPSHG